MKIFKQIYTGYLKKSLLQEIRISLLQEEGIAWYVREIDTGKDENDTLRKFQTREGAEAAYKNAKEMLTDNGYALRETIYTGEKKPEVN